MITKTEIHENLKALLDDIRQEWGLGNQLQEAFLHSKGFRLAVLMVSCYQMGTEWGFEYHPEFNESHIIEFSKHIR